MTIQYLEQDPTAFFQILSNTLFINYPTIRRCTVETLTTPSIKPQGLSGFWNIHRKTRSFICQEEAFQACNSCEFKENFTYLNVESRLLNSIHLLPKTLPHRHVTCGNVFVCFFFLSFFHSIFLSPLYFFFCFSFFLSFFLYQRFVLNM